MKKGKLAELIPQEKEFLIKTFYLDLSKKRDAKKFALMLEELAEEIGFKKSNKRLWKQRKIWITSMHKTHNKLRLHSRLVNGVPLTPVKRKKTKTPKKRIIKPKLK